MKTLLFALIALFSLTTLVNAQTIRNGSGSYLGNVESDGTVRNANGAYLGKVASDGSIRNASGSYIGSAQGVNTRIAAMLFFMNLISLK